MNDGPRTMDDEPGTESAAKGATVERPASDGLDALRALGEPTRRALYDHVVAVGDWVGRDAAADAVGIERPNAAHHLDRLAADGLLEVDYRRISGRQGPGAGRPAKLYRRTREEIVVSLPPRDYELAGRLLAEAVDRSRAEDMGITEALDQTVTSEGHRMGDSILAGRANWGDQDASAKREALIEALTARGFEPSGGADGTVILRNCPFHHLAQEHTELVCGMNLGLLGAAVDHLEGVGFEARLEPTDGACCVRLHVIDQDAN